MQDLKEIIIYFKNITITFVNNFAIRLKLDLELLIGN